MDIIYERRLVRWKYFWEKQRFWFQKAPPILPATILKLSKINRLDQCSFKVYRSRSIFRLSLTFYGNRNFSFSKSNELYRRSLPVNSSLSSKNTHFNFLNSLPLLPWLLYQKVNWQRQHRINKRNKSNYSNNNHRTDRHCDSVFFLCNSSKNIHRAVEEKKPPKPTRTWTQMSESW